MIESFRTNAGRQQLLRAARCALGGVVLAALAGCTSVNLPNIPLAPLKSKESRASDARFALARLSERQEDFDQARELYLVELKQSGETREICQRLAVVSAKQGRFDEANSWFERAEQIGPMTAELACDRGYCLYLRHDLEAAERSLRQATEMNPDYGPGWTNLGLVLGHQQRFQEAAEAFSHTGSTAQQYANLAYVHAQSQRFAEAHELYQKAVSLDPELRPAIEGLLKVARHVPGHEPIVIARSTGNKQPTRRSEPTAAEPATTNEAPTVATQVSFPNSVTVRPGTDGASWEPDDRDGVAVPVVTQTQNSAAQKSTSSNTGQLQTGAAAPRR